MKAVVSKALSVLISIVLVIGALSISPISSSAVSNNQNNIVGWADFLYGITWTAKQNVTGWKYTFSQGETSHIPYSQPVNTNGYIGYGISVDNFVAATNDTGSKFYTDHSYYCRTSTYYGMDCSSFVSLCWGVGRQTTASIPNIASGKGTLSGNIDSLQLGDALNYNGENEKHVILVTDISYSNGQVSSVEITEETPPELKRTTFSRSGLINRYGYYSIYRYGGSVPVPPNDEPDYVNLGDGFYAFIINKAIWKPLTVEANNNVVIRSEKSNCCADQVWKFERQSDGSYKIISTANGQCLDVDNASSEIETNVKTCTDNGSSAQRWYIYGSSGHFTLKAKCSNCVLDVLGGKSADGTNVQMYTSNNTDAQIFQIYGLEQKPFAANLGTVFYAPILNTKSWITIENQSTGNISLQRETGKSNQIWKFQRQEDGSYKIYSCWDGKCIDLKDANHNNGTNIQICEENSENAQRWYLYEYQGAYTIQSKESGKFFDVENGNLNVNANIQAYEWNGTDAQIFSVYQGNECKLKAASLSVEPKTSSASFNWNSVYGESYFHLKLWNGTYWDGEPYTIQSNIPAKSNNCSINLPAGYYEGYLDVTNYYQNFMSNVVKFTIKPTINAKINNNSVTISWGKVLKADSYKVEIYNAKNNSLVATKNGLKQTSYTTELENGTYYAQVNSNNGISSNKVNFSVNYIKDINNLDISISQTSYTYDGTEKKPSITLKDGTKTLINGTDYSVSYKNNTNVGTATVTVTGKGNYKNTATKTFTISSKNISFATVTLSQSSYVYDGNAKEPTITVKDDTKTLTKDTDYTVSYKNNTNAGTATVTVTGKENYGESISKTFIISAKNLSSATVTLSQNSYVYDGNTKKPTVTVKDGTITLTEGTDYSVAYNNNVKIGTSFVTITGTGNYTGKITKQFTIYSKYMIGDTNLDGKTTISDVTAIQRHLAELELFTDEQIALADTNGDGEINIIDATHLQKYLAEFDGIVLGKQAV